ncbi:MAG: PadR family transcriptional regulator [Solirubrobacteraceae bacterium]
MAAIATNSARMSGTVAKQATRPRRMDSLVQWAVLGLVIEHPSYGYELAKRFERAFGRDVGLSKPSYIYTVLDLLHAHGLIEPLPGTGKNARQPKPGYRVTEAGLSAYCERLLEHSRERGQRGRLVARGLALLSRHPEAALAVIDRCAESGLDDARALPSMHSSPRAEAASLAEQLIAEERRIGARSQIPWLEYARTQFKALSANDRTGHGPA